MFPGWLACLVWLTLSLCGCTIWKRSERHSTLESRIRSHSIVDSSGWSLTQSGRLLQLAYSGHQVLILPRGPVRYHPDSGFSGEAGYLLLDSYRHTATARQDSLRLETAQVQRSDSSDSQLHHSDRRQQEKDIRPGWRLPWWGWVLIWGVLVCGVLGRPGLR